MLQPLVDSGAPCFRCRRPILPGQAWQPDHIQRRSEGGALLDPANLWPSHSDCNQRDGQLVTVAKRKANGTYGPRNLARETARARARAEGQDALDGLDLPTLAPNLVPPDVLSPGEQLPPVGREVFSTLSDLRVPDELPDVVAVPTILSPTPDDVELDDARRGAAAMGLALFPQGEQVAAVMEARASDGAPLYDTVVIEIARRSTKTTAALATLLGRALRRPGYRIASTAQDGLRARQKLREVMTALRAHGFERDGLGELHFSNGLERIEFANGSVWKAIPPDPGAFRSDAFDAVLIDEAGELDPEKADALMAGILPTQDTRPESQTIVAGTPGESRTGLLWDSLKQLRAGADGYGGVVYEASDTETFLDVSDPDRPVVRWELLLRVHPGIGCGLTTARKILSRLPKMGLAKWEREYLCKWPANRSVTALDVAKWRDLASVEAPEIPARVAIAYDVDPDGSGASIVAAWRDATGQAHVKVMQDAPGAGWVPRACKQLAEQYRPLGGVGFDPIGPNLDTGARLARPPFRVVTAPQKIRQLIGAASRIERELSSGRLTHYADPALDSAVGGAAWRPVGVDGRLFARKASASSVRTLVAASIALWLWDENVQATAPTRVRSSAARLRAAG